MGPGTSDGCCTVHYANVDLSAGGCKAHGETQPEACAKLQCEESATKVHVWKPLNYSAYPYTCCQDEP